MDEKILLAHGGGGLLSSALIQEQILKRFSNPWLDRMDDAALLPGVDGVLAFTSDSFVVSPLFFPGGNIGDLAVCGTVNDLAMAGARPLWLSLSLILEEGLPVADLARVLDSVQARAEAVGVSIVCGDTKVVAHGEADGLYINTAGIGSVPPGMEISSSCAQPGDALLVSGVVGLHALAVLLSRGSFQFHTPIASDVAPLAAPVAALLAAGIVPRVLRDLTRGGLAMALHDIAERSRVTLAIREDRLPADEAQSAACDILGLDPLHMACEGRFAAVVPADQAEPALAVLRACPVAAQAAIVGEVRPRGRYALELETAIGSTRVITVPRGEQMPRIC